MAGPLNGVTVLDLSRILSGPYCTMLLRDLGAEVVKLEHPNGGDTARGNGPFLGEISSYFLSINRGKKSVTLDLSKPAGAELLRRLARQADVLVENFRPGTMARYGVGYETLAKVNPRLVYCAVSGFGQTGPYAHLPAVDVVVQGMGGIMSITGEPGGPPVRPGASFGDIGAGLFSAVGVLAALWERAASGKGQMVDIGMMDCQVAILENAFSRFFASGEVPKPLGTRHPVSTPFQAFQASDGWVTVAIMGGLSDMWPLFCAAIERVDLMDNPDYATGWSRTQHYGDLEPAFREAFARRTVGEWVRIFQQAEIPCGPVQTIPQAAADPQMAAREMFVQAPRPDGPPVTLVNTPVKLSRTPGAVDALSPALGEHTDAVLAQWLGMTPAEIAALRADSVV